MEQSLSEGGEGPDVESCHHHLLEADVAATKKEGESQGCIKLHGHGVIDEEVTMIHRSYWGNVALFTPLFVGQVVDEDEEWEQEEEVGDGESREEGDAHFRTETCVHERMEGGVSGGVVRRKNGDISKGRGVDQHIFTQGGLKNQRRSKRGSRNVEKREGM